MVNSIDNTFNIYLWRFFFIFIIVLFLINNYNFNKTNEKFINTSGTTTESTGQGNSMCAKSCCFSGWPSSIELDDSKYGIKAGDMGNKFRATNLRCNNGFTTGCICEKI